MRLIGIGLLAFLLAGVALSLSNSQSLRFTARLMTEKVLGPRLALGQVLTLKLRVLTAKRLYGAHKLARLLS